MRTRMTVALLGVFGVLVACSDDQKTTPANAATGGSSGSGGSDALASSIVISEFSAVRQTEWFEVINVGDATADLSDYALADSDKATGVARTDKAMRFPSGTSLAAGAHLVVITGQKDSEPGPHRDADCVLSGLKECYFADFSISAANAESVHLLGPDDSVLVSTMYPATIAVDATQTDVSVCRVPDGSGDFELCTTTPGAANKAAKSD